MGFGLPSDADGESSLRPVSTFNYWHFSSHIASWAVKDFMGVTVVSCTALIVGMIMTV
jgi:hypothetical protein